MIVEGLKAFQWKAADATKLHYMMASILPYDDTMTALGSADTIVLKWSIAAWDTDVASMTIPTQPSAAEDADAALGASTLAVASAFALASVAATLF